MTLRPTQVHAEQHLGPVRGFRATGAGANREEGVAVVVLAGEQERGAFATNIGLEGVGIAIELGLELGVG
jgi:hypothetical protein